MNKKEAILAAALTLLTRQGIHATPMSAIAKEAGTGMGTIYNYFPNKEILINAIYVQIKQAEKGLFGVFEEAQDVREQFEVYYKNVVAFFLAHPSYFHFMEQLQASPMITAESKAIGQASITAVLALVEYGQQTNVIKPIPTTELLPFIGGTILSYLRLHFQSDNQQPPALSNQLQLVWDAIRV